MSDPPAEGPGPPDRARRPMSTGRKVGLGVLVAVAVLAVGALLLAGAFLWTFAGGWDGIRPEADPAGPAATRARAEATAELPARQSDLDALVAPAAGEPLARGTVDGCRRGQNNWKIRDGYTLRCRTAVVAAYPWPGTQEAHDRLTAALAEHGYSAPSPGDALTLPGAGEHATGRYEADGTELVVQIDPPGVEPLISAYYPEGDAYLDDETGGIVPAAVGSGRATLTVIATRTYYED